MALLAETKTRDQRNTIRFAVVGRFPKKMTNTGALPCWGLSSTAQLSLNLMNPVHSIVSFPGSSTFGAATLSLPCWDESNGACCAYPSRCAVSASSDHGLGCGSLCLGLPSAIHSGGRVGVDGSSVTLQTQPAMSTSSDSHFLSHSWHCKSIGLSSLAHQHPIVNNRQPINDQCERWVMTPIGLSSSWQLLFHKIQTIQSFTPNSYRLHCSMNFHSQLQLVDKSTTYDP